MFRQDNNFTSFLLCHSKIRSERKLDNPEHSSVEPRGTTITTVKPNLPIPRKPHGDLFESHVRGPHDKTDKCSSIRQLTRSSDRWQRGSMTSSRSIRNELATIETVQTLRRVRANHAQERGIQENPGTLCKHPLTDKDQGDEEQDLISSICCNGGVR